MSSLNVYNKQTNKWDEVGTYIQPSGEVWETIVDETTIEPIAQYQKDLGGKFKKIKIELIGQGALRHETPFKVQLNNDVVMLPNGSILPRPIIETPSTQSGISNSPFYDYSKPRRTNIVIECGGFCSALCVFDKSYTALSNDNILKFSVKKLYEGDASQSGDLDYWAVSRGFAPYEAIESLRICSNFDDTTTSLFQTGLHITIKGVRA